MEKSQDAVYWVNLGRAWDRGLPLWQTRSNAVIVNNSVLADCVYKVISQKGERTLFERLSTPRPAPKIVLKSAWQSQQLQQDTSESAPSRTRQLVRRAEREQREDQSNSTNDPESSRTRKLERKDESTVEKEPEFKVDLRIEGIAHDVIFKG